MSAGSILAINGGSSSVKFAVFDASETMALQIRGEIENLNAAPRLMMGDHAGRLAQENAWPEGSTLSLDTMIQSLLAAVEARADVDRLTAVGHRVVHGGMDHAEPELVTPELRAALAALVPLDPLHMPENLAPIDAVALARPGLPQIACFDTAFHRTMPPVARMFALPRALSAAGICRYGFHGLSYEYIAGCLQADAPALAKGRVIVAHLGSGASLCALRDGRSIATTFGFSVLDGLVMATRCGNLDPGIILYLARQGYGFSEIEDMLYHRSGLLGVSGISGDIRVLLARDDPAAHEAIALFTYRIAEQVGALASALAGLDGLVFTAGIGAHAPAIRKLVCARLAWLGLDLDPDANEAGLQRISTSRSTIDVRVIATDEELMIARHARAVLRRAAP